MKMTTSTLEKSLMIGIKGRSKKNTHLQFKFRNHLKVRGLAKYSPATVTKVDT